MYPDITVLFTLIWDFINRIFTTWGFTLGGTSMRFDNFFMGCIIFSLVLGTLKSFGGDLAGRLHFLGIIFGGY